MALISPGVQVSVIDESFYTPAEPGTTPMLFVASKQDKQNAAGTGTARGTTKANAGVPFLITSQRDLSDTFGDPYFQTDASNNPVNGGELNEYGLQAAYSYLGVSNRAFVVRADVDLDELSPSASAPAANPANGTYWFDTALTKYGIFEWNGNAVTVTGGQSFTNKTPLVITNKVNLVGETNTGAPKGAVGAVGDYAVVTTTTTNKVYYKNTSGAWVKVGTADWVKSWPTVTGTATGTHTLGQTIVINGTTLAATGTTITQYAADITGAGITGVSASVVDGKLNIFGDGTNTTDGSTDDDGAIAISAGASGTLLADLGLTAGTYYSPAFEIAPHTAVPGFKTADTKTRPTGSVWFKITDANLGVQMKVKAFNSTTKLWEDKPAPVYKTHQAAIFNLDKTTGGLGLALGQLYVQAHTTEAENEEFDFTIFARNSSTATSITSSAVATQLTGAQSYGFQMSESIVGQAAMSGGKALSITAAGSAADADTIANAINAAGFVNIVASVDASNRVIIQHNDGGEIHIKDTNGALGSIGFAAFNYTTKAGTANLYAAPTGDSTYDFHASNWKILTQTASANAPTALTTDGALWYNSIVDEVDIMVHNGTTWMGYQNVYSSADPLGPIVSATEPTTQQDGSSALVTGDIWVSTADLENYPQVHKYNSDLAKWLALDEGDQTSEDGILFADARYGTSGGTATLAPSGTIAELLVSDHLDTDAPDPALYPKGMLLWNLRRSGFNVKKFVRNHVDVTQKNIRMGDVSMATYYPHRWITESANQVDGSGSFGRKAQRKVIIQALQAMVNSNQDIRDDESRLFNVMAAPSYPELIGEMVALNNDRGLTAFIVGDSPVRLQSDGTTLNNWGSNTALAVEDNDNGAVTRDEYLGMFYPSLFTSDNAGNNVVVPPSHGILRTLALSDQVSFPWFAPAGTRRGGITNASAAGFVDAEGEFKSIALNEGQRDTLYANNINPITFLTGAGLVNFGQKTRAKNASALDRINVARLVIYLRSQLKKLAKPYIFEPNDKITRDEIKAQADSLMLELVSQRALYDFLVVCDESNNTPSRIDRNELYLDIAIEPVKAVEFIYIPLRLKNTGEISGL
jgi:hypothetical protein